MCRFSHPFRTPHKPFRVSCAAEGLLLALGLVSLILAAGGVALVAMT